MASVGRDGDDCGHGAETSTAVARVGVIGDLHGRWHEADVRYFNASPYDLLLVTGDLGSGTERNGVAIARSLARLEKPTLVVPGNNDAPYSAQIAAEFRHQRGLMELMKLAPGHGAVTEQSGQVFLCGYALHVLSLAGRRLSVVVARPFAMGNSELSFPEVLRWRYGVSSIDESSDRLRQLVDQAPDGDLIFLAHNGPLGLGATSDDPWGRDFGGREGDWGDRDLRLAIDHALDSGRRVLAVVAGHMHRTPRRPRRASVMGGGVLYVNAARVPRVFDAAHGVRRHHVALELSDAGACVRNVYVESG
jgi:uncharacterized protein (TIGR04168 family)